MVHVESRSNSAPGAFTAVAGLAASLWLGYLALSLPLPAPVPQQARGLAPAPALDPCLMDRDGYWRGRIFGATTLEIDWAGAALGCAGNARPDGRGLRLFFAGGRAAGAERLLLVIGIESDLESLAGSEHPVSVTLVDEASDQFFHGAKERCFARIDEVAPLADAPRSYRVEGEVYCAGAIAAVNSRDSVTLGDTRFAGRLTLEAE
jgi:hypothetical protein